MKEPVFAIISGAAVGCPAVARRIAKSTVGKYGMPKVLVFVRFIVRHPFHRGVGGSINRLVNGRGIDLLTAPC